MSNKERSRPLFATWPAWSELPTEVQQQVEKLVANMYLEVLNQSQQAEECNESRTD